MLICVNAEGVLGKKKIGSPCSKLFLQTKRFACTFYHMWKWQTSSFFKCGKQCFHQKSFYLRFFRLHIRNSITVKRCSGIIRLYFHVTIFGKSKESVKYMVVPSFLYLGFSSQPLLAVDRCQLPIQLVYCAVQIGQRMIKITAFIMHYC